MDLRRAVNDFFHTGRHLLDRLRSSEVDTLTPVDLQIFRVQLYLRACQGRLAQGFKPEEAGWNQEEFGALPEWDQREIIQDWALGVEVELDHEATNIRHLKVLDLKKKTRPAA